MRLRPDARLILWLVMAYLAAYAAWTIIRAVMGY